MKERVFSLKEAVRFCQKYARLIFKLGGIGKEVDCVAISPYDKLNKHLFLDIYKQTGSPSQSLAFYKGHDYDVIVIFKSRACAKDLSFEDALTFLEARNVVIEKN